MGVSQYFFRVGGHYRSFLFLGSWVDLPIWFHLNEILYKLFWYNMNFMPNMTQSNSKNELEETHQGPILVLSCNWEHIPFLFDYYQLAVIEGRDKEPKGNLLDGICDKIGHVDSYLWEIVDYFLVNWSVAATIKERFFSGIVLKLFGCYGWKFSKVSETHWYEQSNLAFACGST